MTNLTWIGGLNVDQFVNQQKLRESANIDKIMQPKLSQLSQKQSMLKLQQNIYTQIQSLASDFYQNLTQLNTVFTPTYQISTATSGILSTAVTGAASAGTHTIAVTQLAQAESVASQTTYTSTSSAQNSAETLSLSIGPVSAPTAACNVTINATDSLQTIANNINTSAQTNSLSLTASIISTADGQYQLVISSNKTGVANQVNVAESVTSGTGLTIATAAGVNQGTILTTARDAQFTYDNLAFDQASNSNVIQGVDITLQNTGSTTLTIATSNPVTAVATALNATVSQYNKLVKGIQQAQAQNGAPDPYLDSILGTVKQAMTAVVGTGQFNSLASAGINLSSTPTMIQVPLANGSGSVTNYVSGLYDVDTTRLTANLNSNFADIQTLLMDPTNGILTQLATTLAPGTGAVWTTLSDPTTGALSEVGNTLANITQQLSDAQQKASDMKSGLLMKYAQLEISLTLMQNTSIFMSEQMAVLSNK